MTLSKTTDAEATTDNSPALIIGSKTGQHLEFDGNELMAKASATTTGTLYINNNGGLVVVGDGGLQSKDSIIIGSSTNNHVTMRYDTNLKALCFIFP